MATIIVNDTPYEVREGQNLLQACLSLGFDIPYFCWHPALHAVGACRQCAVKQYRDGSDRHGEIVMACMTPAAEGTRIAIDDPDAREFRASVIEWLMINHPHDCPVCDEGGECHLQDMTVMTGHNYRRYRFTKRTFRNQDLGPFINHEMNRCIQCYRCRRFYRDCAGGTDFDVFGAHDRLYFGRPQEGPLESEFSGNLVEVCPTGVFTDKTFKAHFSRKWDLQTAPSICVHCGLGCNTLPGERYGELRRIRNRYHARLNGYFLCDRGRFGYEFVNGARRIRRPLLKAGGTADHAAVSPEAALQQAASWITEGRTLIGIGSPRASLEANFALQTLVGEDNFYAGLADNELALLGDILTTLQRGPVPAADLQDVRRADTVLVLGEDLTNTAPLLDLALRQLERPEGCRRAARIQVPVWNDAGHREVVQQEKAPLWIATPCATKLDAIAAGSHHASPEDLARLGQAIGHRLDAQIPAVAELGEADGAAADKISEALAAAERPVVICGAGTGSRALVAAAANIAWALHARGRRAKVALTVPECNSMGLAMLRPAGGLEAALEHARRDPAPAVVVLENDLFRRAAAEDMEALLGRAAGCAVIDHSLNPTGERAQVVLPAATFAECSGTLINSEGRAQRFFQVLPPAGEVRASWRWIRDLATAAGRPDMAAWQRRDDVQEALVQAAPLLQGVEAAAPDADFRALGDKIPRQSFRYSGRTAIQAQVTVHEPAPPPDPDAPLNFSMEGYGGAPPPALLAHYWAPGWNSVQSLNKFQEEIAGPLRGGDAGQRLLEPASRREIPYHRPAAPTVSADGGARWRAVRLHEIYGSEELSAIAPAVAARVPAAYIALGPEDAAALQTGEGQALQVGLDDQILELPVRLRRGLPAKTVGLPWGLPGLPYWDGETRITVFKDGQHE
jgi:NADH-quinone oxidoreductase subunit G